MAKTCSLNQWLNLQLVWSYPLILIFMDAKRSPWIFQCMDSNEQFMFYKDPFTMTVHAIFHCECIFYHIYFVDQKKNFSYLNCLMKKALLVYDLNV